MKKVSSRRSLGKPQGAAKKKVVYRVTNWSEYEQGLIQRGRLDVWVSDEVLDAWLYAGPPQRGAQFHYSDLAIETALTLRKLFKLPLRQTEGFVQSLLDLLGLDLEAPDHTTLSRRQQSLAIDLACRPVKSPVIWSSTVRGRRGMAKGNGRCGSMGGPSDGLGASCIWSWMLRPARSRRRR